MKGKECSVCNGKGKKKCRMCNGIGSINVVDYSVIPFETFASTQEKICPKCLGTGVVICKRCAGLGKII